MNEYDIKRLALIYAIQAEIEAMKVHNATDSFQKYPEREFWDRADQLNNLGHCHNEQLTFARKKN